MPAVAANDAALSPSGRGSKITYPKNEPLHGDWPATPDLPEDPFNQTETPRLPRIWSMRVEQTVSQPSFRPEASFWRRLRDIRNSKRKRISMSPGKSASNTKATGQRPVSHLVVLGHPSPDSFNAAIARRYVETIETNGHDAILRDLYALDFDPRLRESERLPGEGQPLSPDVADELGLAGECDVITFIYPLWFGMPPAIIKGYLDRVFGAGFRLNDLKDQDSRLFGGKRLAVISTSASTRPWLESQGMWVSLRQSFEVYLKTIFGFDAHHHYHAQSVVDGLNPAEADRILYEIVDFARNVCAEAAISLRTRD